MPRIYKKAFLKQAFCGFLPVFADHPYFPAACVPATPNYIKRLSLLGGPVYICEPTIQSC